MKKICKNCKHWQPKQRELDYDDKIGFCDQDRYYSNDSMDLKYQVYVHNAVEKVEHAFINENGTIKTYNSELCTNENFGCIFWGKKGE